MVKMHKKSAEICWDMIAMKREVATQEVQVFRGANVKLEKLATSHCTRTIELQDFKKTTGRECASEEKTEDTHG